MDEFFEKIDEARQEYFDFYWKDLEQRKQQKEEEEKQRQRHEIERLRKDLADAKISDQEVKRAAAEKPVTEK